ncbi:MAG: deoxyribonuclease IV [Actinobacteria bacterium]|nr:deoxyribonuclease IV [Actinomycetota bacterium]
MAEIQQEDRAPNNKTRGGAAPSDTRPLPPLGAHVSTAGALANAERTARRLGAEAIQVFSSNPRRWHMHAYSEDDLAAFGKNLRRRNVQLFVHTSYLINLASPDGVLRERSAAALAGAYSFGRATSATALVTHVGSHRGDGFVAAKTRIVETIRRARDTLEGELPQLLLETSAGGGHSVGASIAELGELVALLGPGIGVCLDTAHLFAAGVPIHTVSGLDRLICSLHKAKLVGKVGLIHFNDSATGLGSKRDRHANLWEGVIGRDGLMLALAHPLFREVPFILEVPGFDGRGPDVRNMRRARLMRRALEAAAPGDPPGAAASRRFPQPPDGPVEP